MKGRFAQHPVTSSNSVRDTVRKFVEKHPRLAKGILVASAFAGTLLLQGNASAKEKPTDSKPAISGEQTPGAKKEILIADAGPEKGKLIVVADSGKGTAGVSASNGQAGPDPGLKTDSLERIQSLVVSNIVENVYPNRTYCTSPCLKDRFETDEGGMQSTMHVPFKTDPGGGLAVTVNTDQKNASVAVNGRGLGSIDLVLLGNPKNTVFAVEQGEDKDGEYVDVFIVPVKTFGSTKIRDGSRYLVFTYGVTEAQLYQEVSGTLHSEKR